MTLCKVGPHMKSIYSVCVGLVMTESSVRSACDDRVISAQRHSTQPTHTRLCPSQPPVQPPVISIYSVHVWVL